MDETQGTCTTSGTQTTTAPAAPQPAVEPATQTSTDPTLAPARPEEVAGVRDGGDEPGPGGSESEG